MSKTVVFGDMHNRDYIVRDLFRQIGLMDDEGNRAEGFHTIQLGDLLSLGYGEQEAEFLKWVRPFIDVQLIGNHELPVFTPYPENVLFWGWDDRDRVAEQMVRSEHRVARMHDDPNLWVPATHVGDWLITHAGLSVQGQKELGIGKTAKEYATILNEMWTEHITERTAEPIFLSAAQHVGGIFWIRLEYLRAGYRKDVHVPQIVGHTGFDHNQKFAPPALQNRDGNLIGIDTPGSCCALITEDGGKTWDMVTSRYETSYGDNRERGKVFEWKNATKVPTKLV